MINPHGGILINRVLTGAGQEDAIRRGVVMPRVELSLEQTKTVENIATGVYSPLQGFMNEATLAHVLADCRLPSGEAWTLPVLLPVTNALAKELASADEISLWYGNKPLALLQISQIYSHSLEEIAQQVYGTLDLAHPGVAKVMEYPGSFLAGEIVMFSRTRCAFPQYKFTPAETRAAFLERGWHKIVAFQTRNAPHLGHEYVQKSALTFADGLFLNPVLGKKKPGDFTDDAIIYSYEALLKNYFPMGNTMLAVLEYEMEYAGPKEAIHHAIMRKNFGCTHLIVGRDHAGVGGFYHPYAAQEIFAEFPDLEIEPVVLNSFFYCVRCRAIANDKICPHPQDTHIDFSGTKIRHFFAEGTGSLDGLMRPEVIESIQALPNYFV